MTAEKAVSKQQNKQNQKKGNRMKKDPNTNRARIEDIEAMGPELTEENLRLAAGGRPTNYVVGTHDYRRGVVDYFCC